MATPIKHLAISLLLLLVSTAFDLILARTEEQASQCEAEASGGCYDKEKSLELKLIAIFTILVSSIIGIGLPLLSRALPMLQPDRDPFVIVKALASGVILSTGFMHVLPDSWNDLSSPCLPESPWKKFPFPTFIAMVSAVATMMMDTIATAYYKKNIGAAKQGLKLGAVHTHTNTMVDEATAVEVGGGCEGVDEKENESKLLRYRIVAQVLEVGIVVHSVVIGLSMGVSNNPCTIRPLVAAMCFHQLFEGMGLGGCILQAEYGLKTKAIMVGFFSVTTPFGIALGIGLLKAYNENSPGALIVVGVLNAISAGLLIYMALVNLLATDFLGPRLQARIKLQISAYMAVLLGLGIMSLMAKWA
ncbi:hypothetical protein Ancab_001742 [Ancistrocladus abbreviatus]